jgi:hypothetical protein
MKRFFTPISMDLDGRAPLQFKILIRAPDQKVAGVLSWACWPE